MKMKRLLFITALFIYTLSRSQVNFLWVDPLGGANSDFATSSVTDSSGNVYVTGYFSGTADFDPSPNSVLFTSYGGADVFFAKYGPWGNLIWAKRFGGISADVGLDIAIDKAGYIYIGGVFQSTCNFNTGAGAYNLSAAGFADDYVAKFSPSGNLVWARSVGNSYYDNLSSITLDAQANLYYTGYASGIVDFDPSPATYTVNVGSQAVYFSKLDSSGNFLWVDIIPFSTYGGGNCIEAGKNGNIYVCGYGYGTGDFDPGPGTYTIAGSGDVDIFLASYTSSGNLVWAGMTGSAWGDQALSVALDTAGNVGITGYYSALVDFDFGPGTYTLSSNGGSEDLFIAKYQSDGTLLWAKGMGHGSNGERGYSCVFDKQSNFYVAGPFTFAMDFDPGPGVASLNSMGGQDAFFAKYNSSGNYVWAKQLPGFGTQVANNITLDDSTNCYVTGYFDGATDFDVSPATFYATGTFTDAFVAKYTECNIPSKPLVNAYPTATICNGVYNTTLSVGAASLNAATSWQWYLGSCGVNPIGSGTQIVVNPTVTTTYYVRGEGGCAGQNVMCSSITIFVGTSPTVAIAGTGSICAGTTVVLTASGAQSYTWSNAILGYSTSVSPSVTSTYSVVGAANGCTVAAFKTLTVQSLPTLSVSASPTAVCPGQISILNVTGAVNYTWNPVGSNNSSVIVIPVPPANYTVAGTDNFGCANSAVISVSIKPVPSISIINTGSVCPLNGSLSATGANAYSWSTGSQSYSTVITPSAPTSYTVIGINALTGCSNIATTQVQLYPLPAISIFGAATLCPGGQTILNGYGGTSYTWSPGALSPNIAVSPSVSTTYTLTGASAYGCTNTAVRTVTVYPSPTVSILPSSSTLCAGGNLILVGSGVNTYSWSNGYQFNPLVVSPSVSASFYVIGTSVNGCTATASTSINVFQQPTVGIITTGTQVCAGSNVILTSSPANSYSWSNGQTSNPITVSPLTDTSYSVLISDINGCTGMSVQQINVLSLPVVTITASNPSVCVNSSLMLIANGAITYTWSNNSNNNPLVLYPLASAVYSVTGSDVNGCQNNAAVSINVQSGTPVTLSPPSATICAGDSVTISASGANTYTWQPGNLTGNSIVVAPGADIIYSVTATGTDVCNSYDTVLVKVNTCTGISERTTDDEIKIYPNPLRGKLTVLISDMESNYWIEITDATGRLIYMHAAAIGTNTVDLENVSAGMYYIHVFSGTRPNTSRKLIVE
jgi:hypothetical protein